MIGIAEFVVYLVTVLTNLRDLAAYTINWTHGHVGMVAFL